MANENAITAVEQEIIKFNEQARLGLSMIENDPDLGPDGKRRQLAQYRDGVINKHQELRQKYFDVVASEKERLYDLAFGLGKFIYGASPSETQQIRTNYVNVLNQAQQMHPGQLFETIQNARLAGDSFSARAIARAAYEIYGYSAAGNVLDFYKKHFGGEAVEQLESFDSSYGTRRDVGMKMREKMILGRPII